MSMIRVYVAYLLHTPLPDLSPPGFINEQLHGLQSLPRFCAHLKLLYGLRALEPLAKRPASETLEAIVFAARILSTVGAAVSHVPDPPLTYFIDAATLALNELLPENERTPVANADLIRTPGYFSLLLAAEMRCLHAAKNNGHSDEIIRCAADLILAVWKLADEQRRTPGKGVVALFREKYWSAPTTEPILRNLQLEFCEIPNSVMLRTSIPETRLRRVR